MLKELSASCVGENSSLSNGACIILEASADGKEFSTKFN